VNELLREVRVGKPAHGGSCVARQDGKVVFVRGTAPGEVVDVAVDEERAKFARGHAVAVHEPHPGRRTAPCPVADRCGGCDWQHLRPEAQRDIKRQVVAELLRHQADVDFDGQVEAAAPADLGWRSRMRYAYSPDGAPGLRAFRSNAVVPLPECCRIAHPSIAVPPPGPPNAEIIGAATADGPAWGESGDGRAVPQLVGGRPFQVALDGFWQPHTAAGETLTRAVLDGLLPEPGQQALDLYCGVGVFAAALAQAGCHIIGVELDRRAIALARLNGPQADFRMAAVPDGLPTAADLVVLDPPRSGAGQGTMRAIFALGPKRVAYVSCDPATLARDLAGADDAGYQVASLRAFDLFPNTHHVECLAVLARK
jgi:tRNA/tmRNA/rRNA uracil-C5-methylase (TrmA/RlmC/RlmD family)